MECQALVYKNVLRHNTVTQDVFFNNSENIPDYLANINPLFQYTNVPAVEVTAKRCNPHPLKSKNVQNNT